MSEKTFLDCALENDDARMWWLRDAIHTHFVTLIDKWTIVGWWVKHRADKRGKVGKIEL